MMSLPRPHRLGLRVEYLLSALFLGLSIQLLTLHVSDVRAMRDVGLPAALALPSIEHRMSVLKEQSEVAQLQASIVGDSTEEMLHMYVLPSDTATDRLLATLDTLTTELRRQGMLSSLSPIHTGDAISVEMMDAQKKTATFSKIPVTFEADVTGKGLQTLFLFQNVSGLLTVSDVLTSDEQSALLRLTEEENPAAITALETFLGTDLLSYAQSPDLVENQLFKSFSSDSFTQTFHSLIGQSSLGSVASLLSGPIGHALQRDKLWPLRFLVPVDSAIRQIDTDQFHVALHWEAYNRVK